MNHRSKIRYAIISSIIVTSLVLGSVPQVSYAEPLSGVDSSTLSREPQQTPDGLGATSLGALQYADPVAQIDLVQPPVANNQGDAQVAFPLSVPPGRAGVQPDLALIYSSMGSNGWAGLGWNLSVGEVSVDTRWGVPRYNTTQESESYLLDGELLSPNAIRSSFETRQPEKKFQRRVEGTFERIVRHGTKPGEYWWEVTDKNGTRRYYGGTRDGGRDESAILTDANHYEFRWGLKQVIDISNNTMTFVYEKPTGSGVGSNNLQIGQELYLSAIHYTGSLAANTTDDPAYEVTFVRENRPDVMVDARGGFLRVASERLKQIVIKYRGSVVRSYNLNYSVGAFGKSLLTSIDQYGSAGSGILATHTFTYYDDLLISGNTYQGFVAGDLQNWNTQMDNVSSGVDLGVFGDGRASALGGTESLGGDGRVYLGFNLYDRSKDGSAGAGLVFKGEDDFTRLEMIDINGDNLPDKVFEQNGAVVYRLNQSGPDGTTTFSPGAPLAIQGIDHLSRESNFLFSIGLEAYFFVSVMFNHAWAWTWGKAYFADVNTDGLPDFVDQGRVYFNHLDASGKPVFTLNSADTAVPIDAGTINPALMPNLSQIEDQIRAQAPLQDVIRRWRAPWNGQVKIEGDVQLLAPDSNAPIGDGVQVAIQHEGVELWSEVIDGGDYTPRTPTGVANITVSRGEDIYFRLQSRDDGASDQVAWDPRITYLGVAPSLDANGLDNYSYQAAEDFTLAGRNGSYVLMPLDGMVHISGTLNKLTKTTDDIAIQVLKNDVLIQELPIGRDQVGMFSVDMDVDVTGNDPENNIAGDKLSLALKIDSPVDLTAFSWYPEVAYISATQNGQPVPVLDENNQPTIVINPPVNIQIYPGTDLTAPQITWTAPTSDTLTLTPDVQFCAASVPGPCLPSMQSGTVAVTVKKVIVPQPGDPPAELVAKQIIQIQNGMIIGDPSFSFTPEQDAEYWIDFSVAQPNLAADWRSASLNPSMPFARHWSYIPTDVFPEPYRGWGVAGYNGDGDWGTQPIIESRLEFDPNDYPQPGQEPVPIDPNNEQPSYPDDFDDSFPNPVQGKAYAYAPAVVFDANGIPTEYWRGAKENLYGSASGASSSRLGPDSISMPGGDFAGASAVTLRSITEANAIAGGLSGLVGGGYAWGDSRGLMDFLDMNGDQFPDILGDGGVQYTLPRGGRETNLIPLATFDVVRKDSSTTKTFNGGGDAPEIKADSKGQSNTPQDSPTIGSNRKQKSAGNSSATSSGSGDNSQTSGSIGISGDLGWSSTNTPSDASPGVNLLESDLADMNGDGLPDRVRAYTDGRLTVTFNLGYKFDTNEVEWPGGSLEQGDSQSFGLAPSLGFSYGKLAFSGGISLGSSKDKSLSTWTDLNGDGLPDQLTFDGSNIRVRFGTGAGLTGFINWGSWQQSVIARSQSQSISGGVDLTIGIGPLCTIIGLCYLIINPGFHVTGGMSRQEVEIRDINGDGYPDHLFSLEDGEIMVLPNQTGRTNLLKSVANPLGGSFEIGYTRTGNTTTQPFSQWVMSSLDVDDGRPGDGPSHQLTTYQYDDNIFNVLERDFMGYRLVTEEQRDTNVAGNPIIRFTEREYSNSNVFERGLLVRETLRFANGTTFSESINSWSFWDVQANAPADLNPDPAGVGLLDMTVFPQQVKVEFQRYSAAGTVAKSTWNTYAYDSLGNIIEVVDVGEPDLDDDNLTAILTYTNCTADDSSWVSLPDTFNIQDTFGNTLRSRRAEVLCENGAITKLWEDTGSGEALTELEFDPWGNYNRIIYPPNENGDSYEVNYTFDSDRHTDIAYVTDSYGLVGTATYDGATGQVIEQTDANGQVTSYTYDPYGRVSSITGPYEQGSGNASVTFEYFPTAPNYAYAVAHNFDVFHPGDPIDAVSFLDGISRVTQIKQDATLFRGANQTAQDGMIVSGAVEFDALGREIKVWYPIEEPLGSLGVYNYSTAATSPTLTTWDINDRVTQTVAPDGSTTSIDYGFDDASLFGATMFMATFTDQLGNISRTYTDVRDNQRGVVVEHQDANGLRFLQTSFQYDPLQQLVGVTDIGGNQTTHEYDLLGRRTSTTTPDGGQVTYTYDLASHLIAKVTPNLHAAGGEIHYSYYFDRLTGISYTDGTPNVTYTYGVTGAPGNGAGRIIQVEDGARVQLRAYGRQGELTEETTTMLVHNLNDGTEAHLTWTTHFDYDTWGRTKSITYPDGEVVSYAYDSGGLITAVSGVKGSFNYPYIERQEYDEFFAPRFHLTGNQVATETYYDPDTRRMSRQIIDAPGRRIQDLNYTYDVVGNVLAAANNSPSPDPNLMGGTSLQEFTYDDLYRLVSATGDYNYSPNKIRRYNYDLTYDDPGNILRKQQTDVIINKPNKTNVQHKTTYDHSYVYAAAPHQPTQIGSQLYTYDLNGNFAGWTDMDSGKNRTATWDAENRLTSVADQGSTTHYKYTDDGTRAIQRGPQGEVSYVNRYYTVQNGTVAWKDIFVGDQRIVTKKQMPDGELEQMEYFFHKDLLGSTNLVTDPNGQVFQHVEYFPSGESWVVEHSTIFRVSGLYTGSYYDEFRELYNFGARWYSPRDGLFYSTEPLLETSPTDVVDNPNLLTAYTYAESNPLRLVDRDGRIGKNVQRSWTAAIPTAWKDPADALGGANRAATSSVSLSRNSLIDKIGKALDPKTNVHSSRFKKFATFKFPAAFQIRLTRDTSGNLQLKNIKVFGIKLPSSLSKKGKR